MIKKEFGVIIDLPNKYQYGSRKDRISKKEYQRMCDFADREQQPIIKELKSLGATKIISFKRANEIGADITLEQMKKLLKKFPGLKIRKSNKLKVL